MLKDFREAFCIGKNIASWLFGVAAILALIIFMNGEYSFMLVAAVILPMLSTSVFEYSAEQDEIADFDKIQLTYPLTRREIVRCKYYSGMLTMGGIFGLILLLALYEVYGAGLMELKTALQIWGVGIVVGVAFFSITYLVFFLFGKNKGNVIYLFLVVSVAVTYVMISMGAGVSNILSMDKGLLIAIGLAVDAVLLWGSYQLSVNIYTKKHS